MRDDNTLVVWVAVISILTVVMIGIMVTLKVIGWMPMPWWQVLSPLWVPPLLSFVICVIITINEARKRK